MSKTYVKKEAAYEDVKSTASTFLVIGLLGIIALILIAFDIIPLSMGIDTKILMTVVMGVLFVIFLIIGIVYQRRLSTLKTEIAEEETTTQTISDWFFANYTAESIDSQIIDKPDEEEALYFARYEIMAESIRTQYPQLSESFLDNIIEEFYGKLF